MDVNKLKESALNELEDEATKEAKSALKAKLRELKLAEQVVKNVKREIEDLEADISDGTFDPESH